jgi:outer membrane lipoprotein-sorting protein
MMNKALRFGLVSAFVALFLFAGSSQASAQEILRTIVQRMDAHNKSLASLKADVRMEKFNSQLGETDTTSGSTSYLPKTAKRQMYVRIDWTKPMEEHLVIIGDQYKLYRPRLGQVINGKVDKVQKDKNVPGNALAFMSMSQEQLKTNYNASYIGEESVGGTNTWHLQLLPKTKTGYKMADLWVDGNGMPIQAKITEQNNDTTTVLLSGVQKNVTVSANDFNLALPKGVKVIQG